MSASKAPKSKTVSKAESKTSESIIESKENDEPLKEVEWKVELTYPGQKYATPAPGNGDRVFYQTLLEQNPSSEMAQEWCLYYGVVRSESHAESLYKIVNKRKGKDMTPIKKDKSSSSSGGDKKHKESVEEEPKKKKSKKPKYVDDDVDDDTAFEKGDIWEGQGKIGV